MCDMIDVCKSHALHTLHMSAYKAWICSSCSLLTTAAVLAAELMEGVVLEVVCSLSSSAAAFLLGSTYSAEDRLGAAVLPTSCKSSSHYPTWLHLFSIYLGRSGNKCGGGSLTAIITGSDCPLVPWAVYVLLPYPVMLLPRHPALAQLAEGALQCNTFTLVSASSWVYCFSRQLSYMLSWAGYRSDSCLWVLETTICRRYSCQYISSMLQLANGPRPLKTAAYLGRAAGMGLITQCLKVTPLLCPTLG